MEEGKRRKRSMEGKEMRLSMDEVAQAVELRKNLVEQNEIQSFKKWNSREFKLDYDKAMLVIKVVKLYFSEKYGVSE